MDGVTIKVDGLADLSRALKKIAPETKKRFNKQVKGVVGVIVQEAKTNASSWSKRIPGAIAPTVTNKGVGIRISKKRAPHAGLYERGAAGSRGGTFKHPLFGNRNFWEPIGGQPIRPFLAPAMEANREPVVNELLRAVEEVRKEVL